MRQYHSDSWPGICEDRQEPLTVTFYVTVCTERKSVLFSSLAALEFGSCPENHDAASQYRLKEHKSSFLGHAVLNSAVLSQDVLIHWQIGFVAKATAFGTSSYVRIDGVPESLGFQFSIFIYCLPQAGFAKNLTSPIGEIAKSIG